MSAFSSKPTLSSSSQYAERKRWRLAKAPARIPEVYRRVHVSNGAVAYIYVIGKEREWMGKATTATHSHALVLRHMRLETGN